MSFFKEERKRLNLSQQDVADLCQNSTRTISYWENEKFTASVKKLKILSENGFDVGYLLTGVRVKNTLENNTLNHDAELLKALEVILQTHKQQTEQIIQLIEKIRSH